MAAIALGRFNYIILDDFFFVFNTHGMPLKWGLMDQLSVFSLFEVIPIYLCLLAGRPNILSNHGR